MASPARTLWSGLVVLRDVTHADLPIFFHHQRDPDAIRMAAFATRDWETFIAHWTKVLTDPTITKQTIVVDGQVTGHIVAFNQDGKRQVGYWLGRDHWGRGLATRALQTFLVRETTRPLYAHVAKHNVASLRVLEKCGFWVIGEETGFLEVDGEAVGEYLLQLSGNLVVHGH